MLLESLQGIFRRDLGAARRELEAYPDEILIWAAVPGLPNSAGVLVRHVTGNLQHYLGAVLGNTGYRRDREAEFGAPPWPRSRLVAELAATEAVVARTLGALALDRLPTRYPQPVAERELGTVDFLVHLAVHCGFHLGQLDYRRRAATGSGTSIGPMGITALASARAVPPG
jgi:hypothetical protein